MLGRLFSRAKFWLQGRVEGGRRERKEEETRFWIALYWTVCLATQLFPHKLQSGVILVVEEGANLREPRVIKEGRIFCGGSRSSEVQQKRGTLALRGGSSQADD